MPRKKAEKNKEVNKEEKEIKKVKMSQEDFNKKVMELADRGLTSEKIGETLRAESIHPKEYGKKISKILKERGRYISPDLKNIENKLDRIKKHSEKNKQDKRAMREKERVAAQIRKLKKYLNVEMVKG